MGEVCQKMNNENKTERELVSLTKENDKENRHWIYWWVTASLLPLAVIFLFSWSFGALVSYQPDALVKLFFLFIQIGFVTAYFIRHGLREAVFSLWATVGLLFLLSLIVPYFSMQSQIPLDMRDLSGEFGTPLYLFISCLTAAWLLPGKWRWIARFIFALLAILYILLQFTYIGYYTITEALISVNMMLAIAQTNLEEAVSYINVNLSYTGIIAGTVGLVLLTFLIFYGSQFTFMQKRSVSKKGRVFLLLLFLVNCSLSVFSVEDTRIAHVYEDTYHTIKSFGEYQQILQNRRNLRIRDPEILKRLKAAHDGVYVLIIGESLTRDHMNVYGYKRETTPFQTQIYTDPEYTFFNHAYSSYTQTVQTLTYALTEKNQYNDIALADAYSLIDLAREAGFKTTWISNQSRFGIWDTPIGAIGSECDDQYWINQYVGTDVITKDYDTALVPYLEKIDPNNRRQLIVIHLMGNHISYWDRYPGEFYHWPEDPSKVRSTEEIMNDEYDNSVLFNDYVLESLMNKLVNYLNADGVIYFSDHGEEVAERPGHNADQFNFTMVHIPFWIYTSEFYRESNPGIMNLIYSRRNMPFSNDMVYDTLMGLMGLKAAHYDPTSDIFSSAFNKDVTTLMTMYGNIMIRTDVEQLGESKEQVDKIWNDKRIEKGLSYYDWGNYKPVELKVKEGPPVENEGLSQRK